MIRRTITTIALFGVLSAVTSCGILDGDATGSNGVDDGLSVMQQPVFLEPVFVLEGLDELPAGVVLEELHLGVGAIFLEVVGDDSGIAYANHTPFQLHFDELTGDQTVEAPRLTLPHGGDFQVSVQLEPQVLVGPVAEADAIARAEGDPQESSVMVKGTVQEVTYDDDGSEDEPVPLPWLPEEVGEAVSGLQRTQVGIPFTYNTDRTVRFVVDEVHLIGGSTSQLIMRLQVGTWVEETIQPALVSALSDIADNDVEDGNVERNLELDEKVEAVGDGMDGLIGGMDVEVKQ